MMKSFSAFLLLLLASLLPVSAQDTTEVWGHMIYNSAWNGVTNHRCIVKFNVSEKPEYTTIYSGVGFSLYLSSTFSEDALNLEEVYQINGTPRCIDHRVSTKTWKEISHTDRIYSADVSSNCSAYDPKTRLVYGQFYNDDRTHLDFGTVDFEHLDRTGGRTAIRPITTGDTTYVALAFDDRGCLYGVTLNGSLIHVDKSTGYGSFIGHTGIKPSTNYQSMAYDKKNKRLLWNGVTSVAIGDSTGVLSSLYSIDTNSGKATKLFDFPGNAEFVSLHVPYKPAQLAPDTVTNLKAEFQKANTTGTVSFTLPAKAVVGSALTGQLHWILKDGTTVAAEGNAAVGTNVSKSVTVTRGYHSFHVAVSNSAGESAEVYTPNSWIGDDNPKPAQSVTLKTDRTTGAAMLSWKKPEGGVHNGYIGQVKYDVVRYPDNVKVASALSDSTFSETLPTTSLKAFTYGVTAIAEGGDKAEEAQSNRGWAGTTWEVPVSESFDDAESMSPWFVINNNNDRFFWKYDDLNHCPYFSASSTSNDDWLLSPFIHMQPDRKYIISFDAIENTPNNGVEYRNTFNVYFGKLRSTEIALLDDSIQLNSKGVSKRHLKYVVAPNADGKYCFAIRDISPKYTMAGTLFFENFKVDVYAKYTAPDSVRNLTVTPAERGELKATVTFTTPTKTMGGDALSALTGAYVVRDDSVVIKKFDTVSPGQQLSAEDDNVSTDGFHTYTAYAINSEGDGVKYDSTAYVGIDIPKQPRPLKLINNGDGTGVFLWEEPEVVGVNGGYVSTSDLTYNLYYYSGGAPQLQKKGITSNFAALNIPNTGDQKSYRFLVSAVSRAGEGRLVISEPVLGGAPYPAPFKESWANCRSTYSPWIMDTYKDNGFQFISTNSSDNDNGALYFTNVSGGEGKCTLYSPMVSLDKCVQPYVKLAYYYSRSMRDVKFSIGIEKPNLDIVYLDTIDFGKQTGSTGWREVSSSIEKYKDLKYVRVVVYVENKNVGKQFIIDNMRVENAFDNNLSVSIHVPAITRKGKTIKCTAAVKNNGNNPINGYDVIVRADGEEFDRLHVTEKINVDSTIYHTFTYAIPPTAPDSMKFEAEVDASTDDYDADNVAERTIDVKPSEFATTTLAGTKNGDVVSLTWQAPANTNARVTEDFESIEPFTLTDFAPWKVVDGDAAYTNGPAYFTFPHIFEPMAFICLDNSQMDGVQKYPQYDAHSGNQYLADFSTVNYVKANDDWLISPELSGEAQTVRLYVKTPEENYYPEKFEFRWSTTDDKVSSMTNRLNDTCYNAIYEWGYLDAPVPAGAKYFAIHVNTSEKPHFMIMLDDITYSRGGLKPVAYYIYQDGRLVGTVNPNDFAGDSYTMTVSESEPHKYNVAVVYDEGISPLSNTVNTDPTGIATVRSDNWTVAVRGPQVYVNGLDGHPLLVTDTAGATFYHGIASGQVRVELPAGIYIVRVGDVTKKVVVK